MKRIIAILAAVLMLTAVLTACGEEKTEATPDSATADTATKDSVNAVEPEKLKLIETTEDGTKEEDKEGNVLTINKDDEIVSIKDKDGNEVSVTEYVATHYISTSGGTTYGEPEAASGSSGSSSSKSDSSSSKSESSASKPAGSSSKSDNSSSKASGNSSSSKPASSAAEDKPETSSSEEEQEVVEPTIIELPQTDEYELPIL